MLLSVPASTAKTDQIPYKSKNPNGMKFILVETRKSALNHGNFLSERLDRGCHSDFFPLAQVVVIGA